MGRLLAAMEQGADVAIGSRALYSPETHIERKWGRAVIGRIFAFLVNAWVVPGIADTQCGFKMFRRDIAQRIFELQRLNGFAFDVEVLRIASLLDYRIIEVPINWTNIEGSKVRLFSDSLRMLRDVFWVRYLVTPSLGSMLETGSSIRQEKVPLNADL
jgi:dolichyl-phosphate beta-glucosyltransferase